MFFESKITKRAGLPWLDSRSKTERMSDEYYEQLSGLMDDIEVIEDRTQYISELDYYDYECAYSYVSKRIKLFKDYLRRDYVGDDKEDLMESIDEVKDELESLQDDAIVYDGLGFSSDDDDDDDEDEDFDDDYDYDFDDDDDDDDDDFDFDDDDDGDGNDWGW